MEGMRLPVRMEVAKRPHPLYPGQTVVQRTVQVEATMIEGMLPGEVIANEARAAEPRLKAATPRPPQQP